MHVIRYVPTLDIARVIFVCGEVTCFVIERKPLLES